MVVCIQNPASYAQDSPRHKDEIAREVEDTEEDEEREEEEEEEDREGEEEIKNKEAEEEEDGGRGVVLVNEENKLLIA